MEVTQTSSNSIYLSDKKQSNPVQTLDKDAFLQIMIAQLKYQDPTSPMDTSKFIEEMAQFTTLEQITNLNSNMEKLYSLQQFSQASSLIDCEVKVKKGDEDLTGTVQKVTMDKDGVKVWVNNQSYTLEQVTAVERRAPNGSEELLKALSAKSEQQAGVTSEGESATGTQNGEVNSTP